MMLYYYLLPDASKVGLFKFFRTKPKVLGGAIATSQVE